MYNLRVGCTQIGTKYSWKGLAESLPINLSATRDQIKWTDLNQKFSELFKPDLGTLKNVTAKLYIKQNSFARFMKHRSVPFERRWKLNLIEWLVPPYQTNRFFRLGSPIVPVLKRNSQVRICGDFKQTVNPVLHIDKYPILNTDDLYSKVSWGYYFMRLDLSDTYLQVPLDEEIQRLTMINTHKGLFMYTRLCFGIISSPGVFQRIIDQLIQWISKTVVYLDDILITGQTVE